jgi:hypothetical protein
MNVKVRGLDELKRKLDALARRARRLEGTHSVRLRDLFNPDFMERYTEFSSIDEMVESSGFDVESADDFKRILDDGWDTFVASRTRFRTWKQMLAKAGEEYIVKKLGF